jgi:hypothetical protein
MSDQLDDKHRDWISKCEESDKLTEWELNFIKSLKKQLDNKRSLSIKQADILERIYADKTD